MSAAAYLIGGQAEFAAHHLGLDWMSRPLCLALNAGAFNADRLTGQRFPDLPPDASVNYLVSALVAD